MFTRRKAETMKKVAKGNFGYIRYERKKRLLRTLLLYAIPLIIYVTGYIQTGTNMNLLTIVAILGILPASRSMISVIMIFMQKPVPSDTYEAAKEAAGTLTGGYELIFTAYEHTSLVSALVVCGDHVVGYTPDAKTDPAYLEKHIAKNMAANGFPDVQVRIMKDFQKYQQRVRDIQKKQDQFREGLSFTPDSRYPDLGRDEVLYHHLLALCL